MNFMINIMMLYIILLYPSTMIMIFTNIISCNASSWFIYWILMELNLTAFIYLISKDPNIKPANLMNYFLIQANASMLYLFSSLFMYFNENNFMIFPMIISLIVKLGIFPFHMWYIKILTNLNWMNIFLISTIQKIIPFNIINSLINYINPNYNSLMFIIITMNVIYASFMGLQSFSIKIIMGYSSMIQTSWILMLMNSNEKICILYILTYILISSSLMWLFYYLNINFLQDLYKMKFMKIIYMYMLIMPMLSLAGLPPFTGFLMKWMAIKSMINFSFNLLMIFILSSLISTFFYVRFTYSFFMYYFYTKKNNFKLINFNFSIPESLIYMNWFSMMFLFIYLYI
uniref:NADH-ubiquinone oxidoreductase chain 2 n=1 Tax=Wiebesia pumilae TaxID=150944 RepID=A0A8A3UTY3_9HYME|nr:NADH dehydrogenase subunit 2 [Wiebesia pumilae]